MAHTEDQLTALEAALAKGERRVTFGDKTVEYRTVEERGQARSPRSGSRPRSLAEGTAPDPGHHEQGILRCAG